MSSSASVAMPTWVAALMAVLAAAGVVGKGSRQELAQIQATEAASDEVVTPTDASPPPPIEKAAINWIDGYKTARQQAIDEGRSLMVVITKETGCPPCEVLKRRTLVDPGVVKFVNEKVLAVTVNLKNTPVQAGAVPKVWVRYANGQGMIFVPDPDPKKFVKQLSGVLK